MVPSSAPLLTQIVPARAQWTLLWSCALPSPQAAPLWTSLRGGRDPEGGRVGCQPPTHEHTKKTGPEPPRSTHPALSTLPTVGRAPEGWQSEHPHKQPSPQRPQPSAGMGAPRRDKLQNRGVNGLMYLISSLPWLPSHSVQGLPGIQFE